MTREARIGVTLGGLLLLLGVAGPIIAPDPLAPMSGPLLHPSLANWFGTDQFSRDVFARVAHGARISLGVALIAVAISTLIGTAAGLIAGASTRSGSAIASRCIDLGLALPRVVVLLVLLAAVGTLPLPLFAVVLGLTGWPGIARLVRGETLRLRHAPFVTAAEALGANTGRVLWREIFPGTLGPVLVAATLGVADAMLLEAGLSYLGLGVRPPHPSWGGMILEAREYLGAAPWLLLAPGVALGLATCAATLLGDALRRSLQPDAK